jgi:hypothetical protein
MTLVARILVALLALLYIAAGFLYVSSSFGGTPGDGGPIIGLEGAMLLFGGLALGLVVVAAAVTELALVAYQASKGRRVRVSPLTAVLGLFDLVMCGGAGLWGFGAAMDAMNQSNLDAARARWRAEAPVVTHRSEALGVSFSYVSEPRPRGRYSDVPTYSIREEDGHILVIGEFERGPPAVYGRITRLAVPSDTPVQAFLESLKTGKDCQLEDVTARGFGDVSEILGKRYPIYGMHLAHHACGVPRLPDGSLLFGGPIPYDLANTDGRFGPNPPPVDEPAQNVYFFVVDGHVWAALIDGDDPPDGPGAQQEPPVEEERWWAGTLEFTPPE